MIHIAGLNSDTGPAVDVAVLLAAPSNRGNKCMQQTATGPETTEQSPLLHASIDVFAKAYNSTAFA
jgi:hypothetical protein